MSTFSPTQSKRKLRCIEIYLPATSHRHKLCSRSQTANSTDTSRASQQLQVDIITLHEERPSTFNYFVHWLYTLKLDVENVAAQRQETIYAALYALAERFDVPALRRLCFSKIREYNELFPLTLHCFELVQILAEECSPTSMLRKYLVCLYAQSTIDRLTHHHHHDWINQFEDFSQEVGLEVMRRIQTHEPTIPPYQDENFKEDDSDTDEEDFSDTSSEIDSDYNMDLSDEETDEETDHNMDLSDGETESLSGSSKTNDEDNNIDISNREPHVANLPGHSSTRDDGSLNNSHPESSTREELNLYTSSVPTISNNPVSAGEANSGMTESSVGREIPPPRKRLRSSYSPPLP